MKKTRAERAEWIEETKKAQDFLPLDYIKRGFEVEDFFGDRGIVVLIQVGDSVENHGTIYVWQSPPIYDHGADNCEHYAYINWRETLRIISEK
jgi:hypothetical protein